MKRALPEQFPDKFRNHGVLPTRCAFIVQDRYQCFACALGIEAIDGSDIVAGMDARHSLNGLARLARFPYHYAKGLSDGWEGDQTPDWLSNHAVSEYAGEAKEQYHQGYVDGNAAFDACFAAGMFDHAS